ncbi:GAF domain-containing protein [Natronolimnohabitans sp. A-GB9]|uniref:GAF domain-containing protein n=1 Tax=Natronolimnohabitans sp. A-GB9 TaxID=3069757 RepID=UPI0027B4D118|nr:GAF domain-containing protein [Natronolimnohabitans sp. A-GB9]MDQ2049672.1 GAF domain-containing protein [Natronolimnohabitans sp. A-GB9]
MDPPPDSDGEHRLGLRQQEAVADLAQRALETDDFDQFVDEVAVTVAETLGNEFAAVLEYRPAADEFAFRAGVGWEGDADPTVAVLESDPNAESVLSAQPVILEDARTEQRPPFDWLTADDITGGISVRIGPSEEPWGLLVTYSTDRRSATEQDVQFVRNVAETLSAAIENETTRHELEEVYGRISDAFFALDEQWRFTYLNERAEALINYDGRDLVGKDVWDEFPAASDAVFRSSYERAVRRQETVTFEEYYPEPLDAWFEVRAYPSETGLSVYFRDVSERKARERALEQSERRYRTLAECFPNGIVTLFDDDLTYTLAAGQVFESLPVARSEVEGTTPRDVWGDDVADELESAMRTALNGDRAVVEFASVGRHWNVHTVPITDDTGEPFAGMTMAQDVTERTEQASELKRRARQQRAVANLGQLALETDDLDELMSEATRVVADTLDAAYAKVLDLDPESGDLLLCQGVGWRNGSVGSVTVDADENSQSGYTLLSKAPVVVDDLRAETRFHGPELLTSHDVVGGISTIIGSVDEPWGIFGVHDVERRSFTDEDVAFVRTIAVILAAAIERQRGHQTALAQLNGVVRTITDAVLYRPTRADIYHVACDVLADSEIYEFAWIAEVDAEAGAVRTHAEAGIDGCLDGIDATIDPSESGGRDPITDAIRTQDVHVTNDAFSELDDARWRDHAREYGYRSVAAIPIQYDGTLYGVLGLHASRPDAFTDEQTAVIGQIGTIIGHAIAAVTRKRALTSDEVTEVELLLPDVSGAPDHDGTITFDRTVQAGDDEHLVYGTAPLEAMDVVETLDRSISAVDSVQRIAVDGPAIRFEIRTFEEPLLTRIASHGGAVAAAALEDGDLRLTVHVPLGTDVRHVVDVVREVSPDVQTLAHRQVRRSAFEGDRGDALEPLEELTSRQRAVLDTAYYAGFFDWPRENTGEAVADRLDIAPATFHEHLRTAQKRLLESIFDEAPAAR